MLLRTNKIFKMNIVTEHQYRKYMTHHASDIRQTNLKRAINFNEYDLNYN